MIRGSTESKGKQEGVGGKWQGVEREGWEGRVQGELLRGRHSHKENESLMTRMQEGTILSTQAQEGGDGGAGREWRTFQHSSRQ